MISTICYSIEESLSFNLAKKHKDITNYSEESIKSLRKCVGILIFTDSGWQYVLALLPDYTNNSGFYDKMIQTQFNVRLLIVKRQLKYLFSREMEWQVLVIFNNMQVVQILDYDLFNSALDLVRKRVSETANQRLSRCRQSFCTRRYICRAPV